MDTNSLKYKEESAYATLDCCHKIQGLQAQSVLFDFQITGSKNITFHNLMAFFQSRQKHNSDHSIDF